MSSDVVPCDRALSALIGDKIKFVGGEHYETVSCCSFEPGPKGGKIWTYETMEGNKVPYDQVIDVQVVNPLQLKPLPSESNEKNMLREILFMVDDLPIEPTLKTVVFCALEGDLPSLVVAEFLIRKRIDQLNKPPEGGTTKE